MKKGQSTTEYMVLMVVVIASFLAVMVYMKRGIQGRILTAAMGDERASDIGLFYDPRTANSHTVRHLISNSYTVTTSDAGATGGAVGGGGDSVATTAHVQTNSIEWITGSIESGGY